MKTSKEKLQKAIDTVSIGLATKEMIEQSTSYIFKNGMVQTYNDEISVQYPVEIEIEGAVKAQEFRQLISKVKGDEVDIEVEDNQLLLSAGRTKAGLLLQSEIKLPVDEVRLGKKWHTLPEDFVQALKFTMAAASKDMSRGVLVCVHIDEEFVSASDSYRIAQYKMVCAIGCDSFLIPAHVCSKIVGYDIEKVNLHEGWVSFKTKDDAVISCRTYQEKYVDVSAYLNAEGEEFSFPSQLKDMLERVGVFSKRDYILDEHVDVTIGKGRISLRAESPSGWIEEKAGIDTKVECEFAITPYLLRDICDKKHTAVLDKTRMMFSADNWKYLSLLRSSTNKKKA